MNEVVDLRTVMRLWQWDAEVAPHLKAIRSSCYFVGRHAVAISRAVDELQARPDFETHAELMLIDAESQVEAVLRTIQDARKKYSAKPAAA